MASSAFLLSVYLISQNHNPPYNSGFHPSLENVTINPMKQQTKIGKLYIVATPIGHPKDITLRALDVLKKVDAVICEEYRQGSRTLHKLGVDDKELLTLNEHNEEQEAHTIMQRLAKGETMALISDAGTPVFADPGQHLLELLYQMKIPVSPIPGPASLMAALSLCDFPIDRFIFAGFPPRKTQHREGFLRKYTSETVPVILMDTPYRLTKLLTEVQFEFGKNQQILLACDLTLKKEGIYRGTVGDILPKVSGQKREFILILNLNKRKR
jgi:16S rRNA (cytidine1402-2'-O)-methyltransferase